jgi:hypothetical protein
MDPELDQERDEVIQRYSREVDPRVSGRARRLASVPISHPSDCAKHDPHHGGRLPSARPASHLAYPALE